MTSIRFLGAAGTVTGSRHLVQHGPSRVLVDTGLPIPRWRWHRR